MSDTTTPTDPPVPADKARFWPDTITAVTTSGLSVRAFCLVRGLEEKRFDTRRRNRGRRPVARPAPVPDGPASLFVRELSRPTYACRACERAGHDPRFAHARLPPEVVPRGGVGPGLLAQAVVAKVIDHLPLNRQTAILARDGPAVPPPAALRRGPGW